MKVGKSPAVDNLLNEYICKFRGIFIPLLSCLFNILFHQGNFPTCWSERIISLSFKEKNANDTHNYRRIPQETCLSKHLLLKNENNVVSDVMFVLALQML